jgi:putative MATE family efflux protein
MHRRKQPAARYHHCCRPSAIMASAATRRATSDAVIHITAAAMMLCIVIVSSLLSPDHQRLSSAFALTSSSTSSASSSSSRRHIIPLHQDYSLSSHLASSTPPSLTRTRCRRGGTPQHPIASSALFSSTISPTVLLSSSSLSTPPFPRRCHATTTSLYMTSSTAASISDDGGTNSENSGSSSSSTAIDPSDNNDNNQQQQKQQQIQQQQLQYQYTNTNGKIIYKWTKQNFALAIPALIGMLADPLLSLMDTAYVGRVGSTELAALGACTSIFHLAFNAFRATTTATTSLVGNAQSEVEKKQIIKISLSLGVVLGFIVMTILEVSGPWCLATMGVPQSSSLFPPAISYLKARLWAAPAVLAIVVAEGAFRGYGDTTIPLLASLVASVMNLILDPILMFTMGWGVSGAAAATGVSQVGAALVYLYFLLKRQMLPSSSLQRRRQEREAGKSSTLSSTSTKSTSIKTGKVISTILGANLAMVCKQGSLLLAWAYATARATRIGSAHVAAHQVALSSWLVFALILDGAAVSAQVLMSRAVGQYNKVRSLISYMIRFSLVQGLVTTGALLIMTPYLPRMFTSDIAIQRHLTSLMPHLAWQQLLVSLTLVLEALAIGGNQFQLLAFGTTLSTIVAMKQLSFATTVVDIWSRGIVSLFVGRLFTAIIGIGIVLRKQRQQPQEQQHQHPK